MTRLRMLFPISRGCLLWISRGLILRMSGFQPLQRDVESCKVSISPTARESPINPSPQSPNTARVYEEYPQTHRTPSNVVGQTSRMHANHRRTNRSPRPKRKIPPRTRLDKLHRYNRLLPSRQEMPQPRLLRQSLTAPIPPPSP